MSDVILKLKRRPLMHLTFKIEIIVFTLKLPQNYLEKLVVPRFLFFIRELRPSVINPKFSEFSKSSEFFGRAEKIMAIGTYGPIRVTT